MKHVYIFLTIFLNINCVMAQNKLFSNPEEFFRKEKTSNEGNVIRLTDIHTSTFTIYPTNTPNAPCVVVCPGGGYSILAYDLEGTEICDWLNSIGITAVLLKYRVPPLSNTKRHEAPLQDLQRLISHLRHNYDSLKIDPTKIGVIGFSAGAHLSVMASTSWNTRSYKPLDKTDNVSCRPDFTLLIYPAYLDRENFSLANEITVTSDTPPTFIVQTEDDTNYINSSLFYYYALKQNSVDVEMHLYPKGGHGYGLRKTEHAVCQWPLLAEKWIKTLINEVH